MHEVPAAKGRPKKAKSFIWTLVPEQLEDEDRVESAIEEIKHECKRGRKMQHDKLNQLMEITYAKRRSMILHETTSIKGIFDEFPPLQNMVYVSHNW